jgi:hypothetical protein
MMLFAAVTLKRAWTISELGLPFYDSAAILFLALQENPRVQKVLLKTPSLTRKFLFRTAKSSADDRPFVKHTMAPPTLR